MSDETPINVEYLGRVATLTIDNPPVNALSTRTLAALDTALDAIEAAPGRRLSSSPAQGRNCLQAAQTFAS